MSNLRNKYTEEEWDKLEKEAEEAAKKDMEIESISEPIQKGNDYEYTVKVKKNE